MFDRLKLKLTLANVAVVVLIFIIVFTGVYITMYRSITGQSNQLLNMLTYNIVNGGDLQDPKFLRLLGNQDFFIADISNSGEITGLNSSQLILPLTDEYIHELVGKAMMQNGNNKNLLKFFSITDLPETSQTIIIMKLSTIQSSTGYTYLTEVLKKADNSLSIIFINVDYETSLLSSLRFNLVIVALVGLCLVFIGSLFMAGKAVKPIKEAWEKQKNFTADASHELRTPLSVIQANLELVMENKYDTVESQYKWLENIYWESNHMTKLTGDLLLLARADSGQKLLEMENLLLSSSIEEAAAPFVPVAHEKNIKMDFSIEPNVTFFGDELRLKQLAVILIDNAVKYTPSGGSISLGLKNNRDNIEITVSDTGEGIDKEHLDKIFERFYRVDKARNSENGGTGLGLSIACWIVKEHHGTISVNSALGKGTTFNVMLPKNIK
ncbi:alkaline phosphatase synthesis sensor protein PhoR [Oxobacter pfennigii]|uniref:histidine kinase n=1 Tax=Oxobacter pfennigii TaxID=36849 RepID=A0A0P8YGJ8_9CLOT|nr:ATP-binding protein [Oxobacter pfennigii]KPU46150.1 alkaline phosphatase synthesis sensor protein PhoR [Oxobacter pfennigii]